MPQKTRRVAPAASAGGDGLLRFMTDDHPGIKMNPNTVLVISCAFIFFVVTLHILGKISG